MTMEVVGREAPTTPVLFIQQQCFVDCANFDFIRPNPIARGLD